MCLPRARVSESVSSNLGSLDNVRCRVNGCLVLPAWRDREDAGCQNKLLHLATSSLAAILSSLVGKRLFVSKSQQDIKKKGNNT
jgi:hypothetical protein